MKSIKDWQREAHELAREKGWYENTPDPSDPVWLGCRIANIHSELSEAMACVAKGEEGVHFLRPDGKRYAEGVLHPAQELLCKPEGLPIELADAALRLFDLAESLGIDLESAIKIKHAYNKTRPHKHGKKV